VIWQDIRSLLSDFVDVPFARQRFIDHDIRKCHFQFRIKWNYRIFLVNMLEEIQEKQRAASKQYDEDFLFIKGLRAKALDKLKNLCLMQLADQRRKTVTRS